MSAPVSSRQWDAWKPGTLRLHAKIGTILDETTLKSPHPKKRASTSTSIGVQNRASISGLGFEPPPPAWRADPTLLGVTAYIIPTCSVRTFCNPYGTLHHDPGVRRWRSRGGFLQYSVKLEIH